MVYGVINIAAVPFARPPASCPCVCLLFILAQALGKAHRRTQSKYNLPEQMRLVAGLEIGAERGQCESRLVHAGRVVVQNNSASPGDYAGMTATGYRTVDGWWAERSNKGANTARQE